MATQQLSVELPSGTLYVSGTVNGVSTTWTNTQGNIWETVADRASNDIYLVSLTIINAAGNTFNRELTLYYGVLNLITDRTQTDVDRVKYLRDKWVSGNWTGTAEELAEWESDLKGAYNASDLNRVGSAVQYLADLLLEYGYKPANEIETKRDWEEGDIPTQSEMKLYLDNIRTLMDLYYVLPSTPSLPGSMEKLGYQGANAIEQILTDMYFLIQNMAASFVYTGEIYAGEI